MKNETTGYWTFMCNPVFWSIDDFLKSNVREDNFNVNDWYEQHTKPGHLGVIRVGLDNRTKEQLKNKPKLKPGVYGIVQILDHPKMAFDNPANYPNPQDAMVKKLRVNILYLQNLLSKPLLLEEMRENGILNKDPFLINGFQRSSMPLKAETYHEILRLTGSNGEIEKNIAIESTETLQQLEELELKYKDAVPQVKEVLSKQIERGEISNYVKKLNGYKCKVCEALGKDPLSFTKTNGEHYIETHHIVPVFNLTAGLLGLSNLITVCANHHRQFHFGKIAISDNNKEHLEINIDGKMIRIDKRISD